MVTAVCAYMYVYVYVSEITYMQYDSGAELKQLYTFTYSSTKETASTAATTSGYTCPEPLLLGHCQLQTNHRGHDLYNP